ncbi:MAG: hypothetical protein QF724_09860 [Planctomycetota bacterium]|nr:hypothetical protein [Planctomycetota bacterium]
MQVRELKLVLLLGAVGYLPLAIGGSTLTLLIWLALVALAVGVLAGGLGLRPWPAGWAVPGSWMIALALVNSEAVRPLPTIVWGAMAWCGLFSLGLALGRWRPKWAWSASAATLAVCALASGLLTLGGLAEGGSGGIWPAATGALFLDLSPVAFVTECAGLDWMRHPAVYRSGGTAHMGPEVRTAWQGSLAGPGALVFGCLALVLSRHGARRQRWERQTDQTPQAQNRRHKSPAE